MDSPQIAELYLYDIGLGYYIVWNPQKCERWSVYLSGAKFLLSLPYSLEETWNRQWSAQDLQLYSEISGRLYSMNLKT